MSGPKDYTYKYNEQLAERIRQRLEEIRRERAARVSRRLKSVASQARDKVKNILDLRKKASIERLQQRNATTAQPQTNTKTADPSVAKKVLGKAKEAETALKNLVDTAGRSQDSTVLQELSDQLARLEAKSHLSQADISTAEQLIEQTNAQIQEAEQLDELNQQLQSLAEWQTSLKEDEDIQQYQQQDYSNWQSGVTEVMSEHSVHQDSQVVLKQTEKLISEAKSIHENTSELKSKFQERNELLTHIIDSLKEIGFYVSDPAYSDASDPAGSVILKATRGGEEMTTSVDLSNHIRSHWDHVEGEYCKESFFDYVDKMNEKGINIQPKRSDLQQRPILKQKGAKDLPSSTTDQQGA